MNHQGFSSIYDKIILSKSIKDFIKEGWLSPYSYFSIENGSRVSQEILSINEFDIEGDYKLSALERTMDTMPIRAQLLNSYLKFAQGKKGIIYSVSRKHSDHICTEYRNAGINIVRIDSETPREERRLYVQRFRNGLIDIIVNVDIFSEGFDCPDIEFIQLARPTKSLVKYLQQVGRGLRPIKGKGKCLILDNVGSHIQFGLPDAERDWNIDFVGNPQEQLRRNSPSSREQFNLKDISFQEGSDELHLIEDINETEAPSIQKEDILWSESDDALLKTLIIERKCSLEVVASVFRKNIVEIENRLRQLAIKDNETDISIK